MSIAKVIEVIAESEESWEDAAQNALEEASVTVNNIRTIYVNEMQAIVSDNKIVKYRLNAKVTFVVDHHFDSNEGA